MLHLDISKAIKSLLIGILQQPQRIPEAEGRLGTDGVLKGHFQSGGSGHATSRLEGGSTEDRSEQEDSTEHCFEDNALDSEATLKIVFETSCRVVLVQHAAKITGYQHFKCKF